MKDHDIVQEAVIKTITKKEKKKKERQNAKRLADKALQIAVKRREVKGKEERAIYTHLSAEFPGLARREKRAEPSSMINTKK